MDSTRKTASRTIQAIETQYAGCRFRSRLEARWAVFFDTLDIRWEYEPEGFEVPWRLSDFVQASCAMSTDTTISYEEKVQHFCGLCECPRHTRDPIRYLPDFWLPKLKFWVEVKGSLTVSECERLLNVAAALSSNNGMGCHDGGGYDMLVLGPIPDVSIDQGVVGSTLPWRLHMHKGILELVPWDPSGDVLAPSPHSLGHVVNFAVPTEGEPGWPEMGSGCPLSIPDIPHSIIAEDGGPNSTWNEITSCSDIPVERIPATLTEPGFGTAFPSNSRYIAALRAARSARFEHGEQGR